MPPPLCAGAQQVLTAARELFAEHGFDGVSMTAVAQRAGVSKANVFHHFVSKEQLYIEVLRLAVTLNLERVAPLIDGPEDFRSRLIQLVRFRLEHMFATERETRLVVREVLDGGSERARQLATTVFQHKIQQDIAFFRTAQARGELRADLDPNVASLLVGSCCLTYFQCREVMRHTPNARLSNSIGTYAEAIADLMLRGLLAAEAPAAEQRKPQTKNKTKPRSPA